MCVRLGVCVCMCVCVCLGTFPVKTLGFKKLINLLQVFLFYFFICLPPDLINV